MANYDFEVLIAGGGLVGGSLACALAQNGIRVGLIEAKAQPVQADLSRFDLRVFAITRASERIFRNIGAWEAISALRVSPFQQMHVWEDSGAIHFDSADLLEPMLGHIIEMQVLLDALEQRLHDLPNVSWLRPRRVAAFQSEADAMTVELDDQTRLRCALLIGADGAESQVRKLAAINAHPQAYGHHALVTTVATELPHQATAWQHFLPTGPLALLPLSEAHTCSIVWSTTPAHCRQLQALSETDFSAALGEAFQHRLGALQTLDRRIAFPLQQRHVDHYVQPRLALAGDAAHTIHPLAGQGVNLGLLDVASLQQILVQAHRRHQDLGALPLLRRYERWRRSDNQLMISAMRGFKTLFGANLPPLRPLRNLGLKLTNALPPLKTEIMRYAMGLEGDLPALARLPQE